MPVPVSLSIRVLLLVTMRKTGHTALLVDAQGGDSSAGAPRRQLGHLVHERLQRIVLLAQREHDAQVLRDAAQPPDVLLDQLRRAVVVEEDGQDAVHDGTVALLEADVDTEDDVDDRVEQQVQLRLEERADRLRPPLLLILARLPSRRRLLARAQRGRVRQVGL